MQRGRGEIYIRLQREIAGKKSGKQVVPAV
jgi:hypothetical protein